MGGSSNVEVASDKPQRHEWNRRSVVTSVWPLHDLQNSPDCFTAAIWPCVDMQRFYDGARLGVLRNSGASGSKFSPQCFPYFTIPADVFWPYCIRSSTHWLSVVNLYFEKYKASFPFLLWVSYLTGTFVLLPKHSISSDFTPWLREGVKHRKTNLCFI